MPDFHISINKIGTITGARKLKPTEDYPAPWKSDETNEMDWHKDTLLISAHRSSNWILTGIIQEKDMCSAIKQIDYMRKERIVRYAQ